MSPTIERIPFLNAADRLALRRNCEGKLGDARWGEHATQVLAALDAHELEAADSAERRLAAMGEEARVVEAFRTLPPTETEVALIQVLHRHPDSTSGALTTAMGWEGDSAWHMHFGMLCQRRAHLLWPAPSAEARKDRDGKPAAFWSGVLADYDPASGWRLKPMATDAFLKLGVIGRAG